VRLYFEAREHVMHNIRYLNVYGRLKPGVTPSGGVQDLRTVAARLADTYPETNRNWTVTAVPLLEQILGSVKPALIAMLAAAACVLLIGAANLANLFLVRYLARERELAVRAALGATRHRLMRELVVEAAALGGAAGALGVGIAIVGVRALRALAPPTLPRLNEVGVDWRVMGFCAATSVVTVLVFGVLPAWRTTRSDLVDYLKEGGRTTGSAPGHRLQNGLVVLQVAVALVLLSGAGLMVQSFERYLRVNPGFRSEGVLTAHIFFGGERYAAPEPKQLFVANLVERLAATSGIEAAAVSSWIPAEAQAAGTGPLPPFHIIGDPPPDSAHAPGAILAGVSPGYFRLMGIPLLRGREFLSSDDSRARHIVVVDDLLARRFFAGRNPIGERIQYSYGTDTLEIVGVVGSVKSKGLAANDVPFMYGPIAQRPAFKALFATVRAAGDPDLATQPLKRVIASLDPLMPVSEIRSAKALLVDTVGTTRFASVLASLFAGVALILGAIGIYSVLAYIVARSKREIAVRIALGARATQVVAAVVHRALFLAGTGILIGSSAAWLLARGLANAFPGVTPRDPVIFVGAASAFAVTAVLAASIPALRTTRVNPVVALMAP
jgi:predicted permease